MQILPLSDKLKKRILGHKAKDDGEEELSYPPMGIGLAAALGNIKLADDDEDEDVVEGDEEFVEKVIMPMLVS